MRKITSIILLVISFYSYSQTNEADCMYPSNEILPEELKDCSSLKKYFDDCNVIKRNSSGVEAISISCNLYSNGNISEYKTEFVRTSLNPAPDKEIIDCISKIDSWNVSNLRRNELYSLLFSFISLSNSTEYKVKIKWETVNYIELDNTRSTKMRGFGSLLTKFYLSKVVQRWIKKHGANPHYC